MIEADTFFSPVVYYLIKEFNEIFLFRFFLHGRAPPKPFSQYPKAFQSWLRIREDISYFQLTLRFRLQRRVPVGTLRIIYDRES